jgi:CubicO group peptidase (beta-lactamase class C family)
VREMTECLFTPAASPESVGVPSEAITSFLRRIERQQVNLHGFLVVRDGQIAAEGYWAPYTTDSTHRMYSVSKSFVSLAVGLLIDEGKLKLDDTVASFFPDKLPPTPHPYLLDATVRDLLMMSTPHDRTSYTFNDTDWAATFFQHQPCHPPGTVFAYDTAATVILNTIVERIAGVPFLTSMRERLLDPIGASKDIWCVQTPEGTSWGGSGVICTLRDMAKLAYVCMNNGRWGEQQLISEQYVREATSKQIDNALSERPGYGYQIWVEPGGGFAFRGMGSQFAFCFPEQRFLFACIADTQGSAHGGLYLEQAYREEILDKLMLSPLPENEPAQAELRQRIAGLHILPQQGELASPQAEAISGQWFVMEPNPMGITRMRFRFDGDEGVWEYANAAGEHQLAFGLGRQIAGQFPQPGYSGARIGIPGDKYRCLASAAWVDPQTLNVLVYVTDHYLGTLKASFGFKGDQVGVLMTKAAEWFLNEYTGFAGGRLESE